MSNLDLPLSCRAFSRYTSFALADVAQQRSHTGRKVPVSATDQPLRRRAETHDAQIKRRELPETMRKVYETPIRSRPVSSIVDTHFES